MISPAAGLTATRVTTITTRVTITITPTDKSIGQAPGPIPHQAHTGSEARILTGKSHLLMMTMSLIMTIRGIPGIMVAITPQGKSIQKLNIF
jgi:hypothetical protein